MNELFSLKGTHCVLAGSQGLIGKSVALALSEAGATLTAFDREEVDLTDEAQVKAFFKKLGDSQKPTNSWAFINASYPRTKNWGELGFENVSLADFSENLRLQLGSSFLFLREAVSFLKTRGGGSLISYSSIYGLGGPDLRVYAGTKMQNPSPYSATKSGIIGLTRYISTVYGKDGIRANVIAPGGIQDGQPETFVKAYQVRTPMGRMGTPVDIAGATVFLASKASSYMTGTTLVVDGGWSAW